MFVCTVFSVLGNHPVKLQYNYTDLYKILCVVCKALLDVPHTSEPCQEPDSKLHYEIQLDPFTVGGAW